jgi:hypothetical protein
MGIVVPLFLFQSATYFVDKRRHLWNRGGSRHTLGSNSSAIRGTVFDIVRERSDADTQDDNHGEQRVEVGLREGSTVNTLAQFGCSKCTTDALKAKPRPRLKYLLTAEWSSGHHTAASIKVEVGFLSSNNTWVFLSNIRKNLTISLDACLVRNICLVVRYLATLPC